MTPADHIPPDRDARTEGLRAVFGRAWSTVVGNAEGNSGQGIPALLAVLFETEVWRPWLADALHLLSPAEQERVRRKLRTADRDELALAYALHRLVLGSFLSCDPAGIELDRDLSGRPFVHGNGLHTSLSHAHGAIAVAVSRQGFVGIDMEPAARASELPEIATSVMHSSEVDALSRLSAGGRAQALLALWVRKEALLKAAGIGLVREMTSFEAPAGRLVGLPMADGMEGAEATIHMLEAGSMWVAAIAALPETGFHAFWLFPEGTLSGF